MLNVKSDTQMKRLAAALNGCCARRQSDGHFSALHAVSIRDDRKAICATDGCVMVRITATTGTVDELADRLSHFIGYSIGDVDGVSYLPSFDRVIRESFGKDYEVGLALDAKQLDKVSRVFKAVDRPMRLCGWVWLDLEPDFEIEAIVCPVRF